jgi:hypothetical protein
MKATLQHHHQTSDIYVEGRFEYGGWVCEEVDEGTV